MKKLILSLFTLSIVLTGFSQENKNDISEAEKKILIERYRAKMANTPVEEEKKENEISQADKQKLLDKYKPKKELTEAEKQKKRDEYNKPLQHDYFNKPALYIKTQELKTTNSVEERRTDLEKTTVKYYYGKEDTVYKKFEYTK